MDLCSMWDQRFQQDDYFYGTQANDFLQAYASAIPKKGRVLSLGEGEGRNAVYLAKLGFEVVAVDASSVGLQKLERLAKQHQVQIETHCADLAHYTLNARHY